MTSDYPFEDIEKLNFPCPLCGRDLFSISCESGVWFHRTKNVKFCLVVNDPGHIRGRYRYRFCHSFCYFVCKKRNITIDGTLLATLHRTKGEIMCITINKLYDNIFKRLFSLISIDKGFEI